MSFSQNINIYVKEHNSKKILSASILFKEAKSPQTIKEFHFLEQGALLYRLKEDYDTLLIEIKSIGFSTEKLFIANPEKTKVYRFDLTLKPDNSTLLDKVTITAEKKYIKKKDTIEYNVSSYSDGSERKIEEVIGKLPGINVDHKTGLITYKGKSVETVTLEGDNLFGENYIIGTKNINVGIVERIQAIDNYTENSLLQGIEQEGKVSLNLKLKKGLYDLSGDFDLQNGIYDDAHEANNIQVNLLGISTGYKSFGTASFNNIGLNNTPFDYFGAKFDQRKLNDSKFRTEKIIPESHFTGIIDDQRLNANNQFFSSYNSAFKIKPRLSMKMNLYFLKDQINIIQETQKEYFSPENITVSDKINFSKNPNQFRTDLEIKYDISKTASLIWNSRISFERIKTSGEILQNNLQTTSSFLSSKNSYQQQKLEYTKRLSSSKAFQLSVDQSTNYIPQKLMLESTSDNPKIQQRSAFKTQHFGATARYLGSNKLGKYNFTLNFKRERSPYKSNLVLEDQSVFEPSNDFVYKNNSIYQQASYNFKFGKWQIMPNYSLKFINQELMNYEEPKKSSITNVSFAPSLIVRFSLSGTSFISLGIYKDKTPFSKRYLIKNPVIIDNRTEIKNIPILGLQKRKNFSLNYYNNDLYNQVSIIAGISITKTKGNIISKSEVTEISNSFTNFYSPSGATNFNSYFQISKFIPFLRSKIKLSSNFSVSKNKNEINNSDLRTNKYSNFGQTIFFKSAFKWFFNFENSFSWNYSSYSINDENVTSNNSSVNNFKLIFNPSNKWYVILSSECYSPDFAVPFLNINFTDINFYYTPKNEKWDFGFSLKNLFNEKRFVGYETSDLSLNSLSKLVLNRHFLVNLTYSL